MIFNTPFRTPYIAIPPYCKKYQGWLPSQKDQKCQWQTFYCYTTFYRLENEAESENCVSNLRYIFGQENVLLLTYHEILQHNNILIISKKMIISAFRYLFSAQFHGNLKPDQFQQSIFTRLSLTSFTFMIKQEQKILQGILPFPPPLRKVASLSSLVSTKPIHLHSPDALIKIALITHNEEILFLADMKNINSSQLYCLPTIIEDEEIDSFTAVKHFLSTKLAIFENNVIFLANFSNLSQYQTKTCRTKYFVVCLHTQMAVRLHPRFSHFRFIARPSLRMLFGIDEEYPALLKSLELYKKLNM